jgi:LysR family glycine cleavage system transcriptional activator
MQHSQTHLRSRPISAGHLRAFEAVARHLNFRAAAEEMALTQSAVSRQIQSLEEEVGVSLTTFASFASMWLIPRLEAFQRDNPEIDIRIDASDVAVDLEVADVDIALRYGPRETMPATAVRLFGETLTPVASPWLLKSNPPIKTPADITRFTLIEAGDAHRTHLEWLTWRRWFEVNGLERAQPKRWLYFNYAYQMVQAALTGQGITLARSSLIAESLANGDLVEVLPQHRMDSPMAYWLIAGPRNALRPEIRAFWDWLQLQAATTRETIGEVPDPDTVDNLD